MTTLLLSTLFGFPPNAFELVRPRALASITPALGIAVGDKVVQLLLRNFTGSRRRGKITRERCARKPLRSSPITYIHRAKLTSFLYYKHFCLHLAIISQFGTIFTTLGGAREDWGK